MANHALPTPFIWGDIELSETLIIDSIPHATKTAMGGWLDYTDPRDAINKIVERNPYIDDYSVAVKLTATDGKNYDSRVYHPIGFLLIVMKSGQPKAEAMNRAVAEFVWHYINPHRLSPRDTEALFRHRLAILKQLSTTRDAFIQEALIADLRRISFDIGQPVPDVVLLGADAKQMQLKGV